MNRAFNVKKFVEALSEGANYVGIAISLRQDQVVQMAAMAAKQGLNESEAAVNVIKGIVRDARDNIERQEALERSERKFQASRAQAQAWFSDRVADQGRRFEANRSASLERFSKVKHDGVSFSAQQVAALHSEQFAAQQQQEAINRLHF